MTQKFKINIGGGHRRPEGFLNLDIDPVTSPDYIVDLEKDIFPFEDNSVTEVQAHHILEHLGAGYFHCLQELYRVCEHGAIIDIQVPHPRHEYFLNDPTHQRPITVEGLKLFSKKANQRNISEGFASSNLGLRFNVDFEIVSFNFILDPFYTNQDFVNRMTEEQFMRLGREANNFCQETHIKLVVVK